MYDVRRRFLHFLSVMFLHAKTLRCTGKVSVLQLSGLNWRKFLIKFQLFWYSKNDDHFIFFYKSGTHISYSSFRRDILSRTEKNVHSYKFFWNLSSTSNKNWNFRETNQHKIFVFFSKKVIKYIVVMNEGQQFRQKFGLVM